MVRTNIHHKVLIVEQTLLGSNEVAVSVERVFYSVVALRLVGQRELVCLRTHVEVLAQRIAVEVGAEEEATHVGMAEELDTYEVKHLALKQFSRLPQIDDSRDNVATVYLLGDGLYRAALVVVGILKDVDTSVAFLAEVLADNGNKVVEMFLVLQLRHLTCEIVK